MSSLVNMIHFSEVILAQTNVLVNEITYLSFQVNYGGADGDLAN